MTETWFPLIAGCPVEGCKSAIVDHKYYCGKCMLVLEVNHKAEARCPDCKIKASFFALKHGCKDCVHISPRKTTVNKVIWAFMPVVAQANNNVDKLWGLALMESLLAHRDKESN